MEKLQSSSGETLAETMVAALIAGLGLLLLASMIMSASHVVQKGETAMTKYYDGVSKIETQGAAKDENSSSLEILYELPMGNETSSPTGTATINLNKYTDADSGLSSYALK